jgi:hypothetical protein
LGDLSSGVSDFCGKHFGEEASYAVSGAFFAAGIVRLAPVASGCQMNYDQ